MTRHLIRLMWNRKSRNALIVTEIFFSFLVLFGVALAATMALDNWRQPLGFTIDSVWNINVRPVARGSVSPSTTSTVYRQLIAALEEFPNVEAVGAANYGPYSTSNWRSGFTASGRLVSALVGAVTDGFADVIDLKVTGGRWFSRDDDAGNVEPIVVTERLARDAFGEADPVGQLLEIPEMDPRRANTQLRIVGIVQDYRKNGDYSLPENVVFRRVRLDRIVAGNDPLNSPPGVFLIRVSPGTTAAFEEELLARLQSIARDWTFSVQPVTSMREVNLNEALTPIILFATIGVFLLLMVALGLTGVVWQSVTERKREFGLRRAKGASARAVRRQVVAELFIGTSVAVGVGILLVAQLPLLPLPRLLQRPSPEVFLLSLALATLAMYGVTLLCAWYPSRLATTIQPAEALQYE